jgi:malate dehydrogenase (oxaloacetate-decarboxylating)
MIETESKTEKFSELALKYSKFYAGKIQVSPKVPVRDLEDFSIWYTPGVAAVSRLIASNKDLSFEYTGRWNTIAIVTDGSRVLGLGNIGPEGAMPVMEGKSLIFKYLGGVDAVPLTVKTQSQDEIIDLVQKLEPAFGGINLEDTESPKCFAILEELRRTMNIPVWHDDQQGTAGATLAGLITSLKLTNRKISDTRITFLGSGAANIATARLLKSAGADLGKLLLVDSKGILNPERSDIDELMLKNRWKYELSIETNKDRLEGGLPEALKGVDVLIAASKPGPGIIKKEWIRTMNKDSIVFLLANPVPEMWPQEAKEAGAKIVATGRSDFPNQVNNSLVFPGVFRGALAARARTITDEMVIGAANELSTYIEEKGCNEDCIIPNMEEWDVYPRVATAVAMKAVDLGLSRRKLSRQEFYDESQIIIQKARETLGLLLENGVIPPPPE